MLGVGERRHCDGVIAQSPPTGALSSASTSARSPRSSVALERVVHILRRATMGGAARSMISAVPNGRVRMVSGGMIGTRLTERCDERDPRSPTVEESVASSRSPMSVDRS